MNMKKAASIFVHRVLGPSLVVVLGSHYITPGAIGTPATGRVIAKSSTLPRIKFRASRVEQEKPRNAQDIVERALLSYGGRPALYVIQRNGIYRANLRLINSTSPTNPGNPGNPGNPANPSGVQEAKSVTRFIRKPKLSDDLVTIELELPDLKYSITTDGKEVWSTQNGLPHTPSEQEVKGFRSAHEHHYEALLRYKENESKIEYTGSNKIGTLDLDQISLTSPQGIKTVYEISRRTGRIIYINYEEKLAENAPPVKYRLYFKDFRVIQNSIIPYEVQVFQDGKLIEERKVVEAAFNVQMEEKIFKSAQPSTPEKPEKSEKPE
jgi:hypothetical protein